VFKKFLKELGFLFFEKTTFTNKNKIIRMTPIFEEAEKITFLARLNQTQITLLFIIFDCNS